MAPKTSLWSTGVRTGGKVVLKLGGQAIAFAQSARFRDDYGLEPVHIIGQLQTIEYVPMHARHEIQISLLVVRNKSLVTLGLEPATAGSMGIVAAGGGADQIASGVVAAYPARDSDYAKKWGSPDLLTGTILTVLHQKVFDIEVYDAEPMNALDAGNAAYGGKKILGYKNCFYGGGDLSVDANRVLMHNVTFYAQDKMPVDLATAYAQA
jgi:hypothetical protein